MLKYICLIFILILCNVKSQILNASDKSNLDTLLDSLGLISQFNTTNYCGSPIPESNSIIGCIDFGDGKYYVSSLTLNATSSYSLKASDINVFTKLTNANFYNLNFLADFLNDQPFLVSITFDNPYPIGNLFSSKVSNTFVEIEIFNVKSPITLEIHLSYIKGNLNIFTLKTDRLDPLNSITFLNDLPMTVNQMPSIEIDNLKSIPDMSNIKSKSFSINSLTESTLGLNYLNTLSNIETISIKFATTTKPTDFNQFSSIPLNNEITSLGFKGALSKPTSIVNLSNLTKLSQLAISEISNNFNIDGSVPIILPANLNALAISNGLFDGDKSKDFVLNIVSKIPSVDFSNNSVNSNFTNWTNNNNKFSTINLGSNKLYGNVNPSWCTTKNFIISNNELSGELPSCFTCHFQASFIKSNFLGNSFTNFETPPPCTTLIPNLRYDPIIKILTLYGKDLGFDPKQIKTKSVSIDFDGDYVPSEYFTASYNGDLSALQFLDITFTTAAQTYRVSTVQNPPSVTKIVPSNPLNTLSFEGSFFNYNKSSFSIKVGTNYCIVTSATFYGVVCTLSNPLSSYDPNAIVSVTINVDDYTKDLTVLTTNVYTYLNKTSTVTDCTTNCTSQGKVCNTLDGTCIKECPNHCSGPSHGTCNINTGECSCTSKFLGDDCLTPAVPCPNDCSNAGSCNKANGICTCIENRLGLDCSGIDCTNTCEHSSTCDTTIGVCKCVPNYQGSNCTIPSHYITSVIPCTIDGGEVSINGWFGNDQDNHLLTSYSVKIGTLPCTVSAINTTTITCNVGAGTGTKNIIITNSLYPTIFFNGVGLFNYQNPIKTCPKSCTSATNGKCNTVTGDCQCNDAYTGFDCSTLKSTTPIPPTNSSVDTSSGNTTLSNQYTTYEISIIELNEISFDGSLVISYPLYKNWSFMKNNTDLNIFKFIQTLKNNTCTITYTVEEIKSNEKSFTFGTASFTLKKGAIKLSVLIKDYQYQSTLNTLQLVFYSTSGNDIETDCNQQESLTDTTNVDNQQLSSYIQITKNSKKLIGRFINQVIADSRSTFMSSTILKNKNDDDSSITLGLNLPHCNECLIDPDFSVLVTDDFKDSCGESTRNKWVVPVAVVIPVVTIAAIIVIVSILYRKNRIGIKVFKTKLKSLR
ncbi:hypothetical protein ACTFIY_010233 [Dictyostelium cf. discoideum]